MKMYGMDLAEGSEIGNITVPTGTSFPAEPNAGEMFFRTDLDKTYMHNGTEWNEIGSDGVPTDIDIDLMSVILSQSGDTWSSSESLACGIAHTYYAKCEDAADSESDATEINFSIAAFPDVSGLQSIGGLSIY